MAAELDAVRKRYVAQHNLCKAHSAAGKAFATAKTGLTEDDARAEQRNGLNDRTEDGPKWNAWRSAWREYDKRHPHPDPVDEHGNSIAWQEIGEDQHSICRAILKQPTISAVDLAVQVQAFALLNADNFIEDNVSEWQGARRLAEAACKLYGIEAIPTLEYPPLSDDEAVEA